MLIDRLVVKQYVPRVKCLCPEQFHIYLTFEPVEEGLAAANDSRIHHDAEFID